MCVMSFFVAARSIGFVNGKCRPELTIASRVAGSRFIGNKLTASALILVVNAYNDLNMSMMCRCVDRCSGRGGDVGGLCSSEDPYIESLFAVTADAEGVGCGGARSRCVGTTEEVCATQSGGPDVAAYGEVFQCFRIVHTGLNSGGGHHLFCSGFELYGTLYYGSQQNCI